MPARARLFALALPLVLATSAPLYAGDDERIRTSVTKVPGTTSAVASLEGEMEVPAAAVQAVLCDLEGYPAFSEASERVAVVSDDEARAFVASKPAKRSAVAKLAVTGRRAATCPGRTYVLNLLDFPFPIRDGWSLAVYSGNVTGETFRLAFATVVGSDDAAGEYVVTPLAGGRSRLAARLNIDLGIPLPGFLLDWVVHSQLPKMFLGIEREARRRVPALREGP